MVILSTAPPALSCDVVSLYYTRDVLLENLPVLIFYGPSTTENSTQNSSRVQAHIMSLAGFQSFHRLVVSPSSPLYAAVYHLPGEQQGDDIYRGLAVSLLSYFAGLSDARKAFLKESAERRRPARAVPMMFDEMHAGELASRMTRIKDTASTAAYIKSALATQSISWIDIDIVLPTGTIKRETTFDGQELIPSFDSDGLPLFHYGKLDSLMNLLGSPSFLPTSKLRRALSKPTVHSKSRSLLKDQKVLLRREMCEFVDTENRYVGKLHDLANDMAEKFRQRLKGCGVNSLGSTNIPDALFPQCLSTILQLNKTFFNDIQDILQRTENEAIADIEGDIGLTAGSITKGRKWDPTGASEFAMGLLKWFPQFTSPYHEYVRASVAFSDIINEGLQDSATRFLSLVNDIGEQRLRSSLIEPIQRLPRYSLFIDNMVNLLPASHPALISLLKARDLITDICALDTNSFTDNTRTVKCLKNLIGNWPASISPRGRLICAVDATQLRPPYNLSTGGQASVLLLFPEVLVLLQKTVNSTLTARSILAEIDRPALSVTVSQSRTSRADIGITFQTAMDLADIQLTESEDKQLVWVTDCNDTDSKALHNFTSAQASPPVIKVFALLNTYERKATRFCEDVTKARIEGRFSETMRESDKWTTRTLNSPSENLSILASIWEDKFANEDNPQTSLSQIRLLIDGIEMPRTIFAQNKYLHTVARIISLEDNRYRFIVEGTDGSGSSDDVASGDLIRVLFKRGTSLTSKVFNYTNYETVSKIIKNHDYKSYASYTYFCRSILQDVPLVEHEHEPQLRNYRPISPVKMLSNFLGGIPSKQNNQIHTTELISLLPPQSSLGPTFERSQSIKEDPSNNVVTMMKQNNSDSRDVSELLEATLSTYLTALHSKSGNVVGKVLRARVEADELVVNELYNTLGL